MAVPARSDRTTSGRCRPVFFHCGLRSRRSRAFRQGIAEPWRVSTARFRSRPAAKAQSRRFYRRPAKHAPFITVSCISFSFRSLPSSRPQWFASFSMTVISFLASVVDFFHITAYFHLVCVKLGHISRMIRIWALNDFRRYLWVFAYIHGDFDKNNFRQLGNPTLPTIAATKDHAGQIRHNYRRSNTSVPVAYLFICRSDNDHSRPTRLP